MSASAASRPRRPSFAFINRMMAVFGELPGFTPSCFLAEASPPSVLAGARTWKGASRTFRYEPTGASVLIRLHGRARTAEHERAVQSLLASGYERERDFVDETWCRRWLSGARRVVRELDLLATVADDGDAATLPARGPSPRPSRPSAQGFAAYARAVERARGARVGWNGLSLAVWRPTHLAVDGVSDVPRLDVSAIADDGPWERGIHVVAHAYAGAPGGTIPLGLARAIRRLLQSRGYDLFARRRGSPPGAHLRVGGSKTLRSPAAAARECSAVRTRIASSINVRGYEGAGLTPR